ncbi:hypothetical protein [Microcoleus vaginatus]|uniref:hypothetical protein n=1 Tax=Microcoleus vaginatus TaxID=119532 RepID=UPI001F60500B
MGVRECAQDGIINQKEEGRGRRKKEEGRGRRKKNHSSCLISQFPISYFPFPISPS